MRRIVLLLTVGALVMATLAVTTGTAFAKVNDCPPQQQAPEPEGGVSNCYSGGSGAQGGGGRFSEFADPEEGTVALEFSGGGKDTGGGHCGISYERGDIDTLDAFEHGKACPETISKFI